MKTGLFLAAIFAACIALFLGDSTPLFAQTTDLAAKSDQELVNEIAVLRKRIRRLELEREAALLRERSRELDAKHNHAGEQPNANADTAISRAAKDAYAADLPVKVAPIVPVPVMQRWDGFYIGANIGYGFSNDGANLTGTDSAILPDLINLGIGPSSLKLHPGGVVGGGQIGFNSQIHNFVWGIEADVQASGVRGNASVGPLALSATTRASEDLDWFGTFRGRIGFTPVSHILVYATGGVAFGQVKTSAEYTITTLGVPPAVIDLRGPQNEKRFGWTAGGGVEYALNSNWSARFDYLYADLGKTSLLITPTGAIPVPLSGTFATYDVRHRYNFVRFGVNYRFAGLR